MSSSPDQPVANIPADSGLRCPQCEYNLTGLTESRCPECGEAFDPDELRRILAGEPGAIPGWDDRGPGGTPGRFFRVCWMTWFHPSEFGRRFPATFDSVSAARFGVLARLVAAAPFLSLCVFGVYASPEPFFEAFLQYAVGALSVGAIVSIGSLSCEIVVATALEVLVTKRTAVAGPRGPSTVSASWWGFVGLHSTFLVIAVAVCSAAIWFTRAALPANASPEPAILPAAAVAVGWWWWSLARGILVRTRPGTGRIVAVVFIPLAGLACVLVFAGAPILCLTQTSFR